MLDPGAARRSLRSLLESECTLVTDWQWLGDTPLPNEGLVGDISGVQYMPKEKTYNSVKVDCIVGLRIIGSAIDRTIEDSLDAAIGEATQVITVASADNEFYQWATPWTVRSQVTSTQRGDIADGLIVASGVASVMITVLETVI